MIRKLTCNNDIINYIENCECRDLPTSISYHIYKSGFAIKYRVNFINIYYDVDYLSNEYKNYPYIKYMIDMDKENIRKEKFERILKNNFLKK